MMKKMRCLSKNRLDNKMNLTLWREWRLLTIEERRARCKNCGHVKLAHQVNQEVEGKCIAPVVYDDTSEIEICDCKSFEEEVEVLN